MTAWGKASRADISSHSRIFTSFAGTKKPAGLLVRPAVVWLRIFKIDQGMSPATNFGITGPPISAAKRLPLGEKNISRPPIWLSVS